MGERAGRLDRGFVFFGWLNKAGGHTQKTPPLSRPLITLELRASVQEFTSDYPNTPARVPLNLLTIS